MSESTPQQLLRRAEPDRLRSALNSPTKPETPSSQILSLVEALTTAKREIDSQSDRVKQLELLLRRERKARESAEERARLMETHLPSNEIIEKEIIKEGSSAPPFDPSEDTVHSLIDGLVKTNDATTSSDKAAASTSAIEAFAKNQDEMHRDTESIDVSTSRLQERLESMVREMDEMKITMESYKQRAETAEHERKSLAELVEQIRAKESHKRTTLSGVPTPAESIDGSPEKKQRTESEHGGSSEAEPFASPTAEIPSPHGSRPDLISTPADGSNDDLKTLQRTLSTALEVHAQSQRWVGEGGEVMVQSAPFVSMVGVVLIGVGLMTWLNGWQRGER